MWEFLRDLHVMGNKGSETVSGNNTTVLTCSVWQHHMYWHAVSGNNTTVLTCSVWQQHNCTDMQCVRQHHNMYWHAVSGNTTTCTDMQCVRQHQNMYWHAVSGNTTCTDMHCQATPEHVLTCSVSGNTTTCTDMQCVRQHHNIYWHALCSTARHKSNNYDCHNYNQMSVLPVNACYIWSTDWPSNDLTKQQLVANVCMAAWVTGKYCLFELLTLTWIIFNHSVRTAQ
jgi:hypothetical protein